MKTSFKKNILLELLFLLSGVVSWTVIFTLLWEQSYSFAASIVSFLFMAAVLVHARFTDKYWNIPCIIYILLTLTGTIAYLVEEDFPLALNFLNYTSLITILPFAGAGYFFENDRNHLYVLLIFFCLTVLIMMIKKYFRKENPQ